MKQLKTLIRASRWGLNGRSSFLKEQFVVVWHLTQYLFFTFIYTLFPKLKWNYKYLKNTDIVKTTRKTRIIFFKKEIQEWRYITKYFYHRMLILSKDGSCARLCDMKLAYFNFSSSSVIAPPPPAFLCLLANKYLCLTTPYLSATW